MLPSLAAPLTGGIASSSSTGYHAEEDALIVQVTSVARTAQHGAQGHLAMLLYLCGGAQSPTLPHAQARELGKSWVEIAAMLPGRSSTAIRKRYTNMLKPKVRLRFCPFGVM